MDPMPVQLRSTKGHAADGHEAPVEWFRDWRPAHTVAVAIRDGKPLLLRDCPPQVAARLEWALYAREQDDAGRWCMTDTGRRLVPAEES